MTNTIYIGSSCESHIGVGTLLSFKESEVKDVYFDDMESGDWIIELNSGEKFFCYAVSKIETSLGGEIEITDLYREPANPPTINSDALPPSLRHLLPKK